MARLLAVLWTCMHAAFYLLVATQLPVVRILHPHSKLNSPVYDIVCVNVLGFVYIKSVYICMLLFV